MDEPYPSPEEIKAIITEIVETTERETETDLKFTDKTYRQSVDALRGLCAYTAEQEFAMSLSRDGIDIDGLWERKRIIIEQTPGLSVYRPQITLDDIGGCGNAKDFLGKLMLGKNPPKAIVWIDEIDKATAADKTDTSGVSQDRLGYILQYMQDNESKGVVFLGPPGTSKSMMAKALGGLTGILTIRLDLGEMLGGIVGESQHNLREAFKVISAVAEQDVLFIATCNSMDSMDSALQRRFKRGKLFFDLPEDDEKSVIWDLHLTKHDLNARQDMPDDASWTGAEIAACCEMAYDMDLTLREASEYIVPVAVTAKEEIDTLRRGASDRFISASKPGFFRYGIEGQQKKKRKITV
jgi:SpoVK/Ycf46/Vps4 family AAA+-type ATPase